MELCRIFIWFFLALMPIQCVLLGFEAASQFPVEISFLIADLKIDKVKGIQVCEIQNASLSSFHGEKFSHGGRNPIAENFIQVLDSFHLPCWHKINEIGERSFNEQFKSSSNWTPFREFKELTKDSSFIQQSSKKVYDPSNIRNYGSLIFCFPAKIDHLDTLTERFPTAIIIDKATIPYWKDKYEMSLLFKGDSLLENRKPRWALYQSKYSNELANTIIEEIGGDIFVIKPRGECYARGVIIVSKEELDATLKYILNDDTEVGITIDKSHEFWVTKRPDTFIVEKFIDAEPISVAHLGGKLYSPTIRLGFLLVYNKGECHVEFLNAYYKFPEKALSENGTLNEKFITICQLPYYSSMPHAEQVRIEEELKDTLLALYKKMLTAY